MEKRKRGRPPNAGRTEIAGADEILAQSVHCLVWFGFPQRGDDGVYAVIARCAAEALGRRDSHGLPLSAERIEQIYEAWKLLDSFRRGTRKNFTKDSLQARVPFHADGTGRRSLADLAQELINNGGELRKDIHSAEFDPVSGKYRTRYVDDVFLHGDADLTPTGASIPRLRLKRGN